MNFIPLLQSTPSATSLQSVFGEKSSAKKRKSVSNENVTGSVVKKRKRQQDDLTSGVDSVGGRRVPKMIKLHKDILDFVRNVFPLPEERVMRQNIVESIRKVVKLLWPDCNLDVFGSYRTDLYLPSCDIDIVVFGKWLHKPLFTLKNELVTRGITREEDAKVIDKAAVPIIKIIDKTTGVKVDISFNTASGLTSADQIMKYLKEFPNSRPLILVLKQFLSQRDLNEVYSGGVSSYGLMLMVVSFLQLHPRGDGYLEEVNLGVLLIEFFELYGCHFNYLKTGIRLRDGADGNTGRYVQRDFSQRDRFCLPIYDPASDEDNDVLRGSFNMFQVQMAFKQAYKVLTNEMYLKTKRGNILSLIIEVDCR